MLSSIDMLETIVEEGPIAKPKAETWLVVFIAFLIISHSI